MHPAFAFRGQCARGLVRSSRTVPDRFVREHLPQLPRYNNITVQPHVQRSRRSIVFRMNSMRYLILLTLILYDAKYAHGTEQSVFLNPLITNYSPSTTDQSIVREVQPEDDYESVDDDTVAEWNKQEYSNNRNPLVNPNPVDEQAFDEFDTIRGLNFRTVLKINPDTNIKNNFDKNSGTTLNSGTVYEANHGLNVEGNSEINSKISTRETLEKDETTVWLLGGTADEKLTHSMDLIKEQIIQNTSVVQSTTTKIPSETQRTPVIRWSNTSETTFKTKSTTVVQQSTTTKNPFETNSNSTIPINTEKLANTEKRYFSINTSNTTTHHNFILPTTPKEPVLCEMEEPTASTTSPVPVTSTTSPKSIFPLTFTTSPKSIVPVTSFTTVGPNSGPMKVDLNADYQKPIITSPFPTKIPSRSQKDQYPSWPFQAWLNNCPPPVTQENCFPSKQRQQHTSNPITASTFDVKPVTLGIIPHYVHGHGNRKNWGRAKVINYIYIDTRPNNYDYLRPVYRNPAYPYAPQTSGSGAPFKTDFPTPSVVHSTRNNQPTAGHLVDGGVLPASNIMVDASHKSYPTNPGQAGQWLNYGFNDQQHAMSYPPQRPGTARPSSSAVYSAQINQPMMPGYSAVVGALSPANNMKYTDATRPPYPTVPGAKQWAHYANDQHLGPSYAPQTSGPEVLSETAPPNTGAAHSTANVVLIAAYPNGDVATPVEHTDLAVPEYTDTKRNDYEDGEPDGPGAPSRGDIGFVEDYGGAVNAYEQPDEDEPIALTLIHRRRAVAEDDEQMTSRNDGSIEMIPMSTILWPGAPPVAEQTAAVGPAAEIAAPDAEPATPVVQTGMPAAEAAETAPAVEAEPPTVECDTGTPVTNTEKPFSNSDDEVNSD